MSKTSRDKKKREDAAMKKSVNVTDENQNQSHNTQKEALGPNTRR